MRRSSALLGALLLVAVLPGGVAAAAPANDLPEGAIALPFPATIEQDTTEATVGADNVGCGADGTDQATVWYTITVAEDTPVVVDASASSFFAGVNVFEGAATTDALIACGSPVTRFDATAGTTYFLMFADTDGDGTNGGLLQAAVDVAPPAIDLTVTVDPVAKLGAKGGSAVVTGTIACSQPADFADLSIRLSQAVGRFTIRGWGYDSPACGPEPAPWAMQVEAENGSFGGSKATVLVEAFACDALTCDDQFETYSVRFRR